MWCSIRPALQWEVGPFTSIVFNVITLDSHLLYTGILWMFHWTYKLYKIYLFWWGQGGRESESYFQRM